MSKHGDLSDAVYFLNMNYQTGIEASISKSEYKVNEDLDLSGLTVSKIFKNGNKTEIDPSKVTISGYNKKASGTQTVKISYQGYETSFEVNVIKEYTALEFANDFLSLTNDACANDNENNAAKLIPIWDQLKSSEYYQKLASDEIEILVDATYSDASTSAIELAMKRYDHIIERYGLENFITRPVSQYSNSIIKITSNDENNTIAIIASISFVAISLIVGTFVIKRRKEEQ